MPLSDYYKLPGSAEKYALRDNPSETISRRQYENMRVSERGYGNYNAFLRIKNSEPERITTINDFTHVEHDIRGATDVSAVVKEIINTYGYDDDALLSVKMGYKEGGTIKYTQTPLIMNTPQDIATLSSAVDKLKNKYKIEGIISLVLAVYEP